MPKQQQISTSLTSLEKIMNTREFALGVIDGRAGRGPRSDYATWGVNAQWNYERGRAWAVVAPRAVTFKRDGKITAEALRFADDII